MEIAARPQPLEPPLAELAGIQFGLATAKDIVRRDNAALFFFHIYTHYHYDVLQHKMFTHESLSPIELVRSPLLELLERLVRWCNQFGSR